ncbi:hypothetical protein Hanom_Chr13g01227961 [Helianthus anomalus]
MPIKVKPQGPRFKKFEIWTKMTKVPKPQGPKWQFTLNYFYMNVKNLGDMRKKDTQKEVCLTGRHFM